jgi:hypothetical protein
LRRYRNFQVAALPQFSSCGVTAIFKLRRYRNFQVAALPRASVMIHGIVSIKGKKNEK